jgi:WS/DGAT/MGAT family acyltransferase
MSTTDESTSDGATSDEQAPAPASTMRRVSGVDAAFLYGETPSWHMHVSAVLLLDPTDAPGGWSFDRFRERLGRRLAGAPQFSWRLVEVPFGLDRPVFVDDPEFSIDDHLHRIGVPAPGGPEQVGNLVGDLVGLKIDRQRPLWEMWLIEGLADGRLALLAKVHHSIIDGISGSELASVLFDIEADPPLPEPEAPRHIGPIPDGATLLVRSAWSLLGVPGRVARYAGQAVRQGITALDYQRKATSPPVPFQAPRCRLNGHLTPHRRFAYASVPLADVKNVKSTFDVKVNDVVLAICAGALRRYLLLHDDLPASPLIAQVPVSLRVEGDEEVGTKVGAMFASLATNVADPALRLISIHESTRSAKEMQRALAVDRIMGLTDTTPPGLINLAARMYTAAQLDRVAPPIMNLIISNVPGPPFSLYVGGAKVEALFPMGPLLYGTAVNITVFSYEDRIDFGFMACRDLVPDAWELAKGIELATAELVAAAEVHGP